MTIIADLVKAWKMLRSRLPATEDADAPTWEAIMYGLAVCNKAEVTAPTAQTPGRGWSETQKLRSALCEIYRIADQSDYLPEKAFRRIMDVCDIALGNNPPPTAHQAQTPAAPPA